MRNTVLDFLTETVSLHSEKTAIVDGARAISFGEMNKAAKRLGSIISHRCECFRQPVAVILPKSAESIIAFLAILYSGNFYVPMDESMPLARIQTIISNLEPACIMTSNSYQQLLLDIGVSDRQILFVDTAYDEKIAVDDDGLAEITSQVIDTDPVYTIYTSGSTGIPKGVVVAHRGVIDYIEWAKECFGIDANVVIGNQSPFYFDNSTLDIYLSLSTGATLVIVPKPLFSFPMRLMEYLNTAGINFIFWVPSVMVAVANMKILEKLEKSLLTRILFAGEVMPNKHLNYWRKHFPQALFANLYGPTEITVDCTYYIVDREFKDNEALPIGFACRNTDILVLNDNNQPVRESEPGELCVRGSSLALGYWNDRTKTEAVFVQNPLQDKYPERIYRTGDLVYFNERKEIIFVGRKDNQIKHMGYRIELGEIETAVLGLEYIENACVVYDKAREEIVLFFQASETVQLSHIRKALIVLLPKYMMPSKVHQLDSMPFNANGKIDRGALVGICGR